MYPASGGRLLRRLWRSSALAFIITILASFTVSAATGRIRFGLLLIGEDDIQEAVLGIGTDFNEEEKITHLTRFLESRSGGALPRAGQREILLGTDLMDKLGVRVGDGMFINEVLLCAVTYH
jgi:ABC-type lipoprotein release transport system permease subunit